MGLRELEKKPTSFMALVFGIATASGGGGATAMLDTPGDRGGLFIGLLNGEPKLPAPIGLRFSISIGPIHGGRSAIDEGVLER